VLWLLGAAVVASVLFKQQKKEADVAELAGTIKTGDRALDSYALEIVKAAVTVFGADELRSRPGILRALVAILNNELPPSRPVLGARILGDQAFAGGPSVGPMQVYRATAIDLGLWAPPEDATDDEVRAAYADNADEPVQCIGWGVAVFKTKLKLAGDSLVDAVRRYNGGGPKAAAYRDRAVAFIAKTWGASLEEGVA
jgi:hypothetical protein